ncbi:complex I subunit 5 family protein [Rubellimicrobium roseum]|uniref:NADH/ubiquinone/plastoquinone (Complex I) n=1 Tax=Rubellimicrobium roseum TaxID=687525 RepID=A0A5C4N8F2_9RHOB|nr:complex I subunit 5 family protein [Rubellimicrobium roseum]TNC65808.1 NADH/ubiquinone/plastoquinone (complex I) [Rubellimicrobium roseum]
MSAGTATWLVLLVPLLPLLLGTLGAFRGLRAWLPALAVLAPLPALAAALLIEGDVGVRIPWLLLDSRLGLDGVGRVFLALFACLWFLGSWHAFFYLRLDPRRGRFAALLLLAMAGNLGTAVAQDALSFYAAFALMSFASYGLVVHDGTPGSLRAGRVYIVLVVLGELALFSGLVLAVAAAGAPFEPGRAAIPGLALALLSLGFGIKAGLVPLHVWLPLAHPAAPVPASAVLSGAMIKVGLLGALRFLPLPGLPGAGEGLILLGAASALYGVAVGVLQTNPKALLAYSSISQMGLIAIGLGLALSAPDPALAGSAVAAALLFTLHHGFAKAALFLGTALAPGSAAGLGRWLRMIGLGLPAAALIGLPLTSGAVAKAAVKDLGLGPAWLDPFLSVSSAATALLLVRFLALMGGRSGEEKPGTLAPWLASVLLSALAVWAWAPAAEGLASSLTAPTIVDSLWPLGVGVALGLGLSWFLGSSPTPLVPAGDLLAFGAGAAGWRRPPAAAPTAAGRTPRRDLLRTALARGAELAALERGAHIWAVGAVASAALAALLLASLLSS